MKSRPDSFEKKLQPNQLEALERWLFEPVPGKGAAMTYDEAADAVWKDFGVRVSVSALRRFYRRRAQVRLEESIIERAQAANSVLNKVEENPADMYRAVLALVGQLAFEHGTASLNPEVLYNFTKLLIAAKKEETRDQQMKLDRERFEFDAASACLKKLPDLKVIGADTKLTTNEKVNAIRQKLFGQLPEQVSPK